MNKKIIVGLIYGGKSVEHEASKMTAASIRENIDCRKFEVVEIYVDKKGKFKTDLLKTIKVAFLAWHGPNCEDGRFQKYLERRKIKYIGSGPEASRINLDKNLQKKYFQKAGLQTVEFFAVNNKIPLREINNKITNRFGYPCFIKPSNTGSSLGVAKCHCNSDLKEALKKAKRISRKIVVEQTIDNPREIEIAILGNRRLLISEPGEILTHGKFYSYQAKYFKPFKTKTIAKNLTKKQIRQIKTMAKKAYKITDCRGFARIDFFLTPNNKIYINEINTLPGFTKISMFPKMIKAKGVKYKDLITIIINLALK